MARNQAVNISWILAAAAVVLGLSAAALPTSSTMAASSARLFGPEETQTPTPTVTATPAVAIGAATPVACGQIVAGNTTGAANNVSVYGCASWLPLTGPEQVYALSLGARTDVDALLGGLNSDLDLLLLTGASPASCIAHGDNAISARGLAAGVYYLVVDGFGGATGPFQLNVWCPLAITATPTPTITPTITPRPTVLHHYLPLLLHSSEVRQ